MRGLSGLVLGIGIGAAGMYLALTTPWRRTAEPVALAPDAGPAAVEPAAGKGKRRPRRRAGERAGENATSGEVEPAPILELSAAQRRVVWRGDAVALPPASHDFSAPDDARPLSDDEISGVVRSNSRAVIDCIAKAATGTDLRAQVTLQMLVDGQGRVTRHRAQAPQVLFEQGLAACVAAALRAWRFPATGAPTLVTAPFELG